MVKTSKRFARKAQSHPRRAARDIFKKNVEKLQRAGLIGKVDFRKAATPATIRRLEKYKSVISGKAAVVQAPDIATARKLRKQLGLKGSGKTIVVPREKGERYSYKKSTGEIVSERPGFEKGQKIKKTLAPKKFPAPPETGAGKRLYYTIPERTRGAGRLKRKTFSSFNEFLHYIHAYDIRFEDIEDRLEVEEIVVGSEVDKTRQKKISDERAKATARYKRRRKRAQKNQSRAGSGGSEKKRTKKKARNK